MKKNHTPSAECYFERSNEFLIAFLLCSVLILGGYVFLFQWLVFRMHYILILLFPVMFFLLANVLYILLNPLVLIYKDYMEIRIFLFLTKTFYFYDIRDIHFSGFTSLEIVYLDEEKEYVRFFPLRRNQKEKFTNVVYKKILEHTS